IRGNLRKNSAKSSLPGLEGSTYFIKEGVNIFFDGTGNLNKEFGTVINGKLVINSKNKTLNNLVETVLNSLDKSLSDFTDLA
ncbi:hypothetical protein ABK046_50690, partial [Streptomyces caeruleatus]